jgi:divalent metal cation (Fe/Co/Zn/Cd) transporter
MARALPNEDPTNRSLRSAWRISVVSVVWTLLSSALAITIGVRSGEAALSAFGAIGFVDAVGSLALSYHFARALTHEGPSLRLEALAHRVVLGGLLVVGAGALVVGAVRLIQNASAGSSTAALVLAGVSLVILSALSARKRRVARAVASPALRSDSHVTAIGACFAAIALAGTALERWLHLRWADASATVVLGACALALALSTWRSLGRGEFD